MQKLKLPSFSRKLKLGIAGFVIIGVICAALIVHAQTLPSTGLTNTGSLKPPAGSVESPLVMVRDDSVFAARQQGYNESLLVPITSIDWGPMYNLANSFTALNGTCIDLWNIGDTIIYPSWSCDKLPTGCTLTALVCVQMDYYYGDGSGTHAKPPAWTGGFTWTKGDANAFYILPLNMNATFLYKLVFVMTSGVGAIPQMLNFVITINAQE